MLKRLSILAISGLLALTACSPIAGGDSAQSQSETVDVAREAQEAGEVVQQLNSPAPTMPLVAAEPVMALADTGGGASVAQRGQVAGAAVADVAMQMPQDTNNVTIETEEETDDDEIDTMIFEDYGVNPFVDTAQDNLSTFAMDVDTGSYTLARSYLLQYSQMPDPASVRAEEFINYYPANYAAPENDAFAIHMDASPSPYSDDNQILMRVGVQGRVVAPEDRDPALLIFVVDVSGSMEQQNRLHMAKEALEILVGELREDDRVGIVIYADQARVVLEPTPASEQQTIIEAIQSLVTQGSTYAEAGISLAYEMALAHMREDQTNRVVLVSDGVANVGATGPDAILQRVAQGVDSGITLSTVGVGMGNFNDVMMEQLANNGNGNYHYVDNLREARRIFVNNLTSTLQVIGYDAKIQVEFNPETVANYRLIGYENRDVADNQFRDDTVDAGEVGAGHSITALYELELHDNASAQELATVFVRYEDAGSREVVEINQTFTQESIAPSFDDMPVDFQLLATIAEFSEVLRNSPYGTTDYSTLVDRVSSFAANYPAATELLDMIRAAQQIG